MSIECGFKVTLLGTGVPIPSHERFGPSTLVEAGEQKLLIDAGRGATIRLHQIGVPIGRLNALLLTHFHSDHTCGVPDVWLTGWLAPSFGTRTTPFRVMGPRGTKQLMTGLEMAYAADIEIRVVDEDLSCEGIATIVEEFDHDGAIYERDGVKIIAFEVDHGDVIKPAYGYRIEYRGRAAVISGDTRYNENVIKFGADARSSHSRGGHDQPGANARSIFSADHGASHDTARSRRGVLANETQTGCLHPRRIARYGTSSCTDYCKFDFGYANVLQRPAGGWGRPDVV